jgi:ABC-type lipoprotein export system ATPase subunit
MLSFDVFLKKILTSLFRQVDKSLYFHLGISLLINTILIPLLDQVSTTIIIEHQFHMGIFVFCGVILIESLASYHNLYFMEKYKTQFNAIAHQQVEIHILQELEKLSHISQKKLLESNYTHKKNTIKWELLIFIIQLTDTFKNLIPILGYIVWIFYKSPFSILTYSVVIYMYTKYAVIESVESDKFHQIWNSYESYQDAQLSDLIHNRGNLCHQNMAKSMHENEELRGQDRFYRIRYTETINIVFGLVTILNSLWVLYGSIDITFIIIFIQYIRSLKFSLQIVVTVYKQYIEAKKEYQNYIEIFNDTTEIGDPVCELSFKDRITILEGSTFMRDDKIALSVQNTITLKKGSVVYVSGDSGAGKTTFLDILSGVIKHNMTNFQVLIDQEFAPEGFEHLKCKRVYVATSIIIGNRNNSIKNIVTSNRNTDNDYYVWNALKMAECEFVSFENLYQKDINLSKGQLNRLKVARYLYDILVEQPSIVLMDEIADGVDPKTTSKIANNIYSYFRENSILCLVTTHLPYLQEMKYEMEVKIDRGYISI